MQLKLVFKMASSVTILTKAMLDEDNEILSFNNPLIGFQEASNNDMGEPRALLTQVLTNHDIW
jgi:hypothetical protein